jgi:hypothetical protein
MGGGPGLVLVLTSTKPPLSGLANGPKPDTGRQPGTPIPSGMAVSEKPDTAPAIGGAEADTPVGGT